MLEKLKRVSVKDIAVAAGVSGTTVVHALNPPPGVRMKTETREKVRAIAKAMGYKPSFVGRALVSGRTYTIGLIQPSVEIMTYIFYQKYIMGMARAMRKDDYHLLLMFRDENIAKVINEGRIDGVFVMQSDSEEEHIRAIEEASMPAVIINKTYKSMTPDNRRICSIHSDYGRYMKEAIEMLIGLACKSILLIIDPERTEPNRYIYAEYCKLSERYASKGISFNSIPNSMNTEKARAQIKNVLKNGNRWDGIIANGAWVAGLYIEEALKTGSKPGRDFHIVFDDVPDAYKSTGFERCGFIQQPELCGAEAWRVMKDILAGHNKVTELAFPYLQTKISSSGKKAR
ncbi:MAG: hypothetical protein A2017_02280 [Lentisphaerae bacterium GWF2_44_16]|nr:MAG: hypothetical protein A2017_02280 [Lentisphaerae bacterium GWF2_44_16]